MLLVRNNCELTAAKPTDDEIQVQAAVTRDISHRELRSRSGTHPPTDKLAHPQKITAHGLTHSFMSVELHQKPVDEGVQRQAPQG